MIQNISEVFKKVGLSLPFIIHETILQGHFIYSACYLSVKLMFIYGKYIIKVGALESKVNELITYSVW